MSNRDETEPFVVNATNYLGPRYFVLVCM